MKQKRLLLMIIGIAIFAGILCSGIIIVTGIQTGATSTQNTSSRKEKYPQPYTLEKTKIEEFSEASIHLDYANISILPSDDFYLEYRLDGTCTEPDYEVSNKKFHFQEGNTREQYRISFSLFTPPVNQGPFYLNLYVPKDQYFELLNLSSESGNVELEQLNAKKADFSLDYGNLKLGDFTGSSLTVSAESGNIEFKTITCDDLSVSASYGNITGSTVVVSNNAGLDMESGNLEVSQLTADTLTINGDYGNCKINSIALREGNFSLESGNLKLRDASLEMADITSDYGNVTLELADNVSDYNYDLNLEYGFAKIDGKKIEAEEDGTTIYQKQDKKKKKNIQIRSESGDVTIR